MVNRGMQKKKKLENFFWRSFINKWLEKGEISQTIFFGILFFVREGSQDSFQG